MSAYNSVWCCLVTSLKSTTRNTILGAGQWLNISGSPKLLIFPSVHWNVLLQKKHKKNGKLPFQVKLISGKVKPFQMCHLNSNILLPQRTLSSREIVKIFVQLMLARERQIINKQNKYRNKHCGILDKFYGKNRKAGKHDWDSMLNANLFLM